MEIQALNMTVVWLVILVALVVIELLTMGLTTVWFAGGALVASLVGHGPRGGRQTRRSCLWEPWGSCLPSMA